MDIIALTAFLSPFLPFLINLGKKSAETAASKFGEDAWNKAKKIWDKLHPAVAAKEDAKVAAEQVAAKPESENRQGVFREEMEILLKENPDLLEAIAQIWQEGSEASSGTSISQTITNTKGQVTGLQTGGKSQGYIDSVQGDVNL
ncbi:MAG: hypothetical protein WBB28_08790 [Crinalium sp.]